MPLSNHAKVAFYSATCISCGGCGSSNTYRLRQSMSAATILGPKIADEMARPADRSIVQRALQYSHTDERAFVSYLDAAQHQPANNFLLHLYCRTHCWSASDEFSEYACMHPHTCIFISMSLNRCQILNASWKATKQITCIACITMPC